MTEPTDAELAWTALDHGVVPGEAFTDQDLYAFARAVLAKWGTPPAVAVEPDYATFALWYADHIGDENKPVRDAALATYEAFAPQQPTQAQAGAVPLTPIRQAALDLYKPPFRHEYGYIRDANHQMVADDAGSEGALEAQAREIEELRKDADRYRAFIDCGQPICFLGKEYFGKEALDAAIDAVKGAPHGRCSRRPAASIWEQ